MSDFKLFYPVKPLVVSQPFGVPNDAYKRFGFAKHNGIDFVAASGADVCAMADGRVVDTGYTETLGWYVRIICDTPLEVGGLPRNVALVYMHGSGLKCKKDDRVKVGDVIMLVGSTGFSTGPHLHVSLYLCNTRGVNIKEGDPEVDYCIDPSLYLNGYYACDVEKLNTMQRGLIALLRKFHGL